jgi:hypothetical protein
LVSQRLLGGFQLGNRRWYPWLFLTLCVGFFAVAYHISGKDLKVEWVVSSLGAAGGLTTFFLTQHLQETRLFTELFQRFNARYDELNQRLNAIVDVGDEEISHDDRQVLMDYFNLCAEEYLYFKAGYIDVSVWKSWTRGMKMYADVPAIRKLWEEELRSDSYYGFSLSQFERV